MGKLRIISHSSKPFNDREEAGRLLASELSELRGQRAVVLGIPRGGMVVAGELAKALDAELDVVISRKLRTPAQPELAMGAVAEDGELFLNQMVIREVGVTDDEIQKEKERQLAEIRRRNELLRKFAPRIPLKDRIVVVTDDGVATGATMQVALWAVKQEQPKRLICAMPVGSEDSVRRLAEDADEMVCLRTPLFFMAVGQFYVQFEQVEDENLLEILKAARSQGHSSIRTRPRQ